VKPLYTKNRTIGLLGGSFNPAHEGHLHLTEEAIKALKLDQVWWLVSPQNPLKEKAKTSYAERLKSAKKIAAGHEKIFVSDIEAREKTFYSIDTIAMLKRRFPGTRFIWLMGADNLATLHRWRQWHKFLMRIPIAVFDRVPYSYTALASPSYLRMSRFLLKNNGINRFLKAPALVFVHMKRHPASSTAIRKRLENGRF
jgi:nicotinate-nucleotide adenylyltransferase